MDIILKEKIDREIPADDSTSEGEKMFLYGLIRALNPKVVVETGTHKGLTSCYMGMALKENGQGYLVTADPFEWGQRGNFAKFPELPITYFQTPGKDLKLHDPIDFLFIDGFHEKQEVLNEVAMLFPQLSPFAVVVFHDCHPSDSDSADVEGAIKELGFKTVWIPSKNAMRIYQHSPLK